MSFVVDFNHLSFHMGNIDPKKKSVQHVKCKKMSHDVSEDVIHLVVIL